MTAKSSMPALLRLLRPEQWVKNLFVVIPAFFAARLSEVEVIHDVALGVIIFSLLASGIYCFNDWRDIEQDRQHPRKRFRPLASGAVSAQTGLLLAGGLTALAFMLAWYFLPDLWLVLALYLGINIFYSLGLKRVAILDVHLIALGFLLRVFAGGIVAQVPVSRWLIVLTFLLALILALSKRRGEFSNEAAGPASRPALKAYNLSFIDLSIVMLSGVTVVAYLMYTLSGEVIDRIGSPHIYFTTFFVLMGMLRYLQLTIVFAKTESPTRVLWTDLFLQLVLLGWITAFGYLLYVGK